MILPATYLSGLLLMVLALVLTGSWTSLYKAARPFRYELFTFDLAVGVVILAAVAGFGLGSANSNELSLEDNILITGYRLMAWAVAGGFVFSLGNAVMLSAISVGGIAVPVAITFGFALIINAIMDFVADPRTNALLLFGGTLVILVSAILFAVAYFRRRAALDAAAKKAVLQLDPRSKEAREAKKRAKTVAPGAVAVLSVISGILLAFAPRLLSMARETEVGLAPYPLMLFFAGGLFLGTLVFAPFLLAFPVGGSPAQIADYSRAGVKPHVFGVLAGMMLCGGILAANLVSGSPALAALGNLPYGLLSQGAPLLTVLWGVLVFGEFRSSGASASALLWSGFLLYAIGVVLIAFAPQYGTR